MKDSIKLVFRKGEHEKMTDFTWSHNGKAKAPLDKTTTS